MTVTLAKLLKMKNLLVAEMADTMTKIQRENKTEGVNKSKYDLKAEYTKYEDLVTHLVDVKTAIAQHNTAIVYKIYRMSELKNQINMLRQIDTTEGVFTRQGGYGQPATETIYRVQFDKIFVDTQIEQLTKEIVELQDELDTHNHVTKIDL